MAIDGAKNAALFAIQILSGKYPQLVDYLAAYREKMQQEVIAKGQRLQQLRAEK